MVLLPSIVLGLRWMFGPIHLLDQMTLRAGDAVQRRLAGLRLSHEQLGLLGELPHMRRMAPKAERLIFPA